MEFAYDGGGLAKGGTVTLYLDGSKVGEGRVDATGADALLGRRDDSTSAATAASPVSDDYGAGDSAFTGTRRAGSRSTSATMPRTTTTSSPPEERMRVAMARQ